MKILAINGSYTGKKGYTYFLTKKLLEGASEVGANVETIHLTEKRINRCRSCYHCQKEKTLLQCVYDQKDDVREIFTKMQQADLIVYATPVYFYSIAGLLKIFLERMYCLGLVTNYHLSKNGFVFHDHDPTISGKPFVVLACYNNVENESYKNVTSFFGTFSKFHDAPVVGTLIRNAGRMTGSGKKPELEEEYPKIYKVYDAYIQAGRELVTRNKISRRTQRKANQEIIPVPFFGFLKRFRAVKKIIVKEAQKATDKQT